MRDPPAMPAPNETVDDGRSLSGPAQLAAAAAELRARLGLGGSGEAPATLQRVWQVSPEHLALGFHGAGGQVVLVLDATPELARLSLAAGPPEGRSAPWALGQWLRAAAVGRRIAGLEVVEGERIAIVDLGTVRLIAWLFPRGGALFGLDAGGSVRVSTGPSASAGGAPGSAYLPPARPATGPRPAEPPPLDVATVERWAEARRAALLEAADRRERDRLFRGARQKLERLVENLLRDRDRLADFETARRLGELLTAQLHAVRRGATSARVLDWYADPPVEIDVPLDPALDGPRNVERLFQRYRKGRDGQVKIAARLDECSALRGRLSALLAHVPPLDAEGARAALRRLRLLPVSAAGRTVGGRATGTAGQPAPAGRLPYQAFTSRAGERILVGRGGKDNHMLTFQIARGNDTWMHVRDAPGAHVIVPQARRGTAPHEETLRDAAALCVHHSDLRGEPSAEVTITARKHVRAIPGGPPGRVTVAGARTVRATDVAARIERLYRERETGEGERDDAV